LTTRLKILPDPAFLELRSELLGGLARLGAGICAEEFNELLDPLMREIFRKGVAEAGAHEGTIWLVDEAEEHLVPVFNTGLRANQIVGQFKQPLKLGLISMVFASEQPFIENAVPQNPTQSKLLDSLLQVETIALIAVPFYFLDSCRGIISCVQLSQPDRSTPGLPEFRPQHLACIQQTASLLSRFIEHELLSSFVGWRCR
jgi:GAF domain